MTVQQRIHMIEFWNFFYGILCDKVDVPYIIECVDSQIKSRYNYCMKRNISQEDAKEEIEAWSKIRKDIEDKTKGQVKDYFKELVLKNRDWYMKAKKEEDEKVGAIPIYL